MRAQILWCETQSQPAPTGQSRADPRHPGPRKGPGRAPDPTRPGSPVHGPGRDAWPDPRISGPSGGVPRPAPAGPGRRFKGRRGRRGRRSGPRRWRSGGRSGRSRPTTPPSLRAPLVCVLLLLVLVLHKYTTTATLELLLLLLLL